MKRVVVSLALLSMCLSGCGATTGPGTTNSRGTPSGTPSASIQRLPEVGAMTYAEDTWYYQYWETPEFPLEADRVPDMETAVGVATAILGGIQRKGELSGFVPGAVFYDTDDEIWFIVFSDDWEHPGGDLSIALRRDSGEVVEMFFGE